MFSKPQCILQIEQSYKFCFPSNAWIRCQLPLLVLIEACINLKSLLTFILKSVLENPVPKIFALPLTGSNKVPQLFWCGLSLFLPTNWGKEPGFQESGEETREQYPSFVLQTQPSLQKRQGFRMSVKRLLVPPVPQAFNLRNTKQKHELLQSKVGKILGQCCACLQKLFKTAKSTVHLHL